MGRATTTAIAWSPSNSNVAVTAATSYGASPTWYEIIAAAGSDLWIAAIRVVNGITTIVEFEIGTGGAGAETVVGRLRAGLGSSGANFPSTLYFPVPWKVVSGSRVSIRARVSGGSGGLTVALGTFASSPATGSTMTTPDCVPQGAASSVTAPGTAWADGAYAQLSAGGLASGVSIAGIAVLPPTGKEAEIDIAEGGAGAETVLTTFRAACVSMGGAWILWLPALLTPTANTRLAARVRQADTATSTWDVALLVYGAEGTLTSAAWQPGYPDLVSGPVAVVAAGVLPGRRLGSS